MEFFPKPKSPWETYHDKTAELPPHETLVRAIRFISSKEDALDLGAGAFRDSKYLLDEGFKKVVAVDLDQSVLKRAPSDERLQVVVSSFEEFDFPKDTFDLINAQYSLPFVGRDNLADIFEKIKNALAPKGIFVGQFFGDNDSWATSSKTMTFLSREEVSTLLEDMEVIAFEEKERDGSTVGGERKHWHVFDVIVKKR